MRAACSDSGKCAHRNWPTPPIPLEAPKQLLPFYLIRIAFRWIAQRSKRWDGAEEDTADNADFKLDARHWPFVALTVSASPQHGDSRSREPQPDCILAGVFLFVSGGVFAWALLHELSLTGVRRFYFFAFSPIGGRCFRRPTAQASGFPQASETR